MFADDLNEYLWHGIVDLRHGITVFTGFTFYPSDDSASGSICRDFWIIFIRNRNIHIFCIFCVLLQEKFRVCSSWLEEQL